MAGNHSSPVKRTKERRSPFFSRCGGAGSSWCENELNERLTFFGSGKLPGSMESGRKQEKQWRKALPACFPFAFPGSFLFGRHKRLSCPEFLESLSLWYHPKKPEMF
jgi:hypothetical protein